MKGRSATNFDMDTSGLFTLMDFTVNLTSFITFSPYQHFLLMIFFNKVLQITKLGHVGMYFTSVAFISLQNILFKRFGWEVFGSPMSWGTFNNVIIISIHSRRILTCRLQTFGVAGSRHGWGLGNPHDYGQAQSCRGQPPGCHDCLVPTFTLIS